MFTTLISTQQLFERLQQETICIVDCRFALGDTNAGRNAHAQGHIPDAVYAHLDDDLSSPIIAGKTGRHPLPNIQQLSDLFSSWGIDASTQVVVYDDRGGGIAARLWWMLRWLGHEQVAVLDGGWPKWEQEGRPISTIPTPRPPKSFQASPQAHYFVDAAFVDQIKLDANYLLVDSRTAPRYHGEEEPIDPIAGHIPGAVNAPFPENLSSTGEFKTKDELQDRFRTLLKAQAPEQTIFYCGSGVTACHNLLAMEHAGFSGAKLYPGSWSEWIVKYPPTPKN